MLKSKKNTDHWLEIRLIDLLSSLTFYLLAHMIILFPYHVRAQNQDLNEAAVKIAVSPTAASIGKYFEQPVSAHTGIPKIEIPITTVHAGDIVFDVSLRYHGGGIKVDEISGQVGLGWSLSGNGMITRAILGKADELNFSWQQLNSYLNNSMTQSQKVGYINALADGEMDAQPDIYYLSVGGINASFISKSDGTWQVMPANSRLKIQTNVEGFPWIITDDKGIRYKFTQGETTSTSAFSHNSLGEPIDLGLESSTTAWVIKEIEDRNGRKVNFEYDPYNTTFDNRLSENVNVPTSTAQECNNKEFSTVYGVNTIYGTFLKTITYEGGGEIRFVASTQQRSDAPGDKMIERIQVIKGGHIVNHRLFHSYFMANNVGNPNPGSGTFPNGYRLRLDSVRREAGGQIEPSHSFTYHYQSGLPVRNSYSQDHWGYYNGQPNTSSVRYREMGETFYRGANKEPSVNSAMQGTLTKIKFPTGGEISYEYEANRYFGLGGEAVFTTIASLTAASDGLNTDFNFQTSFSVTSSSTIYADVYIQGVSEPCACYLFLSITGGPNNETKGLLHVPQQNLELQPGNYQLRAQFGFDYPNDPPITVGIVLKQRDMTEGTFVNGPGLRIKRIRKNFIGSEETTEYSYVDPVNNTETGEIGNYPNYVRSLSRSFGGGGTTLYDPYTCHFQSYGSVSNYPLSNTLSSYVGYSAVVERSVGGAGNGSKIYRYTNYSTYSDGNLSPAFPFAPISSNAWKRGALMEETAATNGSDFPPVERKRFRYTIPPTSEGYVRGVKVGTHHSRATATAELRYAGRTVTAYDISTDAFLLEADTIYSHDNAGTITTVSTYGYGTQFLPNRITQSKSDGSREVSIITYPYDYSNTTGFIGDMKTAHLLAYPIERVRYREVGSTRTILSGQITTYDTGSRGLRKNELELEVNGPIALSGFRFSNLAPGQLPGSGPGGVYGPDGRYRTSVTYDMYDVRGNLLQMTPWQAPPTSYIWTYSRQHPVAEIRNATFSAVQTALGGAVALNSFSTSSPNDQTVRTFLAPLRTHSGLQRSQVRSWTYHSPLIGLSSETDASGRTVYYEYDGFGRLQTVKDTESKTVEGYRYHYRNQ